jgi:hypothetical protein
VLESVGGESWLGPVKGLIADIEVIVGSFPGTHAIAVDPCLCFPICDLDSLAMPTAMLAFVLASYETIFRCGLARLLTRL